MFSRRTNWNPLTNRLGAALAERHRGGLETLDLTGSNPTRAGLAYPHEELAAALGRAARAAYEPAALGLPAARLALARALSVPGDEVAPDDLVLTASTSEAYSFLFKLLADPGDSVLSATPSYPLLDHLADLESVRLRRFPLLLDGTGSNRRWALQTGEAAAVLRDGSGVSSGNVSNDPRCRAVVAIHPNNPTGSFVNQEEQDGLAELCASSSSGMALISDEVFIDYGFADSGGADSAVPPLTRHAGPAAQRRDVLCFSLGGLSKSAGLPHWKLGWIRLGGPQAERDAARAGLELIADSFLSVATPVQAALPEILRLAPRLRAAIRAQTRANLDRLAAAVAPHPALDLLPVEAGWSAVLRVPAIVSDEDMALALLAEAGVLVHPGYFFDFPGEGYLVVSLLGEEERFATGIARLVAQLAALLV